MARKFTHEEVKHFIEVESGSGCKLLSEEYKKTNDKLKIQCKCGNKFEASFSKFKSKNKRQCNECSGRVRKNTDYFKKEVFDLVGGEYEVIGEYVGANDKIKLRHSICKYKWEITPSNFLRGKRCPKCFGTPKKTNEEFVKEVYDLVGNEYVFLEKYVNNKTKIRCKHSVCGCEYKVKPLSFLSGTRCPHCKGDRISESKTKTNEQFKKEVFDLVEREYEFLDTYKDGRTKIKCKHNIDNCGHEWYVMPDNFLQGSRCPQCSSSTGEVQIGLYLDKLNIKNIRQHSFEKCKNIRPLYFDFYLPDYNLLIEYDGIQHFEPVKFFGGEEKFKQQQENDNIKNQYCKDNNISLLRIPYWERDNVEQILDEWL